MTKQKLSISDEQKNRLKELRNILSDVNLFPLSDEDLERVKGGCGGTCYFTCSFYCESTCSGSCMTYETRENGALGDYCALLPTQNQKFRDDWRRRY